MNAPTLRILVTNDDGVASTGLAVLANHLAADGHEIIIAAPSEEASGSGAAIGGIMKGDEIRTSRVALPEAAALPCYAVEGPPGRCVLAAAIGAFGPPPDLVISGINPGANVGQFLQLHSGTLGAALTAAGMGINGMAVSIEHSKPTHWESAGNVAARLVGYLNNADSRTTLNLNVPDAPIDQIKGLRTAPVESRRSVRFTVEGTAPGVQTIGHELIESNQPNARPDADTDSRLIKQGYAVLTRVVPPADVPLGPVPGIFD